MPVRPSTFASTAPRTIDAHSSKQITSEDEAGPDLPVISPTVGPERIKCFWSWDESKLNQFCSSNSHLCSLAQRRTVVTAARLQVSFLPSSFCLMCIQEGRRTPLTFSTSLGGCRITKRTQDFWQQTPRSRFSECQCPATPPSLAMGWTSMS